MMQRLANHRHVGIDAKLLGGGEVDVLDRALPITEPPHGCGTCVQRVGAILFEIEHEQLVVDLFDTEACRSGAREIVRHDAPRQTLRE